jgi:hypothetical protein
MTRKPLLTACLATALGLVALGATAQQTTGQGSPAQRLSIAEIATLLEGRGYLLREIEMEHGRYEVEIIDANGMRVEADLDPVTGEVLPYRDDDRYDDTRYDREDD